MSAVAADLRVALFATCFNDTMWPGTPKAVVRLLERLGVRTVADLRRQPLDTLTMTLGEAHGTGLYLMSRGLSEDEAMAMIVRGFVEPIARELPMEYALELNRLIELQMEGSVG